jgi:hypothetical protein
MTQIVQEGIEPLLIGTSLLQRIEFQPGMQTVCPAVEPLRAEEAGDEMDLPIYNINIGGAQGFGRGIGLADFISAAAYLVSLSPVRTKRPRTRAGKAQRSRCPFRTRTSHRIGRCGFRSLHSSQQSARSYNGSADLSASGIQTVG